METCISSYRIIISLQSPSSSLSFSGRLSPSLSTTATACRIPPLHTHTHKHTHTLAHMTAHICMCTNTTQTCNVVIVHQDLADIYRHKHNYTHTHRHKYTFIHNTTHTHTYIHIIVHFCWCAILQTHSKLKGRVTAQKQRWRER